MLCVLLMAGLSGCFYEGYAVRRVAGPSDPPLTREEVERLSTAGVSEPVVAEMIEKRGAQSLSPDDLVALKKAGVPDSLVQKMIASERKEVARATEDYYVHPSNYYYYHDYPHYYPSYSSYYYGLGWGWGWGYHHHHRGGHMGVRIYR